jgi:glycine/D-amino acid oxidase-like deaminating enzyme
MGESGQVESLSVGGGILGTMHAVLARRHGYAVTQLEREPAGRGASVRNFGLVWVSGRRAGTELALALRARELWEEIAADAPGTGFRPAGSLTIATKRGRAGGDARGGRAAGRQAARVRAARPDEVREVNPACAASSSAACGAGPTRSSSPGSRCRRCARRWPGPPTSGCPGSRPSRWRRTGCATSSASWHRGDLVVLCTGANFTGVAGPHLAASGALASAPTADLEAEPRGLRRVRLQMLQTLPFDGTADHRPGRRRLAALLPRLRRAVAAGAAAAGRRSPPPAGRSCCWCSAWTGR